MAVIFFVITAGALPAEEMPNIVLLMASGQRAGMAGFEGNTHLKTPHLDALAADAAVFSRAYTPSPYAPQNLASVATGLYPHAFRVTEDGVSLPPGTDTLMARLRGAGYTCVLVGQWGLDSRDEAGPEEGLFDHAAVCMGECPWMDSLVIINGRQEKIEGYLPDWITEHAVEFLSAEHDGPSFLWVNFRGPRPPVMDPPGVEGEVAPEDLPLPESLHYEREGLPGVLANVQASQRFLQMNETQIRALRARYANAVAYLDASVGRILEAIAQGGSDRPTVVIFVSDGGFLLGEHRLYGTGPFFYDEHIRIPFVIRCPIRSESSARIDRVVSLVDLAPTLLALAGQPIPATMHGRSLVPVLQDPTTRRHADECFLVQEQGGGVPPARGMISRHFKYVSYESAGGVLYDLQRDPLELFNAFQLREYRGVESVLENRLDAWRQVTHDPR